MATDEEISNALNELRSAGYSANRHPTKHGFVVVNDPVHRSASGGMLEHCGYEHRTISINKVFKFIDDRS